MHFDVTQFGVDEKNKSYDGNEKINNLAVLGLFFHFLFSIGLMYDESNGLSCAVMPNVTLRVFFDARVALKMLFLR